MLEFFLSSLFYALVGQPVGRIHINNELALLSAVLGAHTELQGQISRLDSGVGRLFGLLPCGVLPVSGHEVVDVLPLKEGALRLGNRVQVGQVLQSYCLLTVAGHELLCELAV